jgi:DNA-binding NarL/FixJ family response regulator
MPYRTYITSWPAPRLQEVMDLRDQGLSNAQVAAELGITKGRVESAVSAARSKYNWKPLKKKTTTLSDRERKCLALFAQGMKAPYISDTLGLTIHSVNSALEKCIVKFGLSNRQELYLYARMQGLDHVDQEASA